MPPETFGWAARSRIRLVAATLTIVACCLAVVLAAQLAQIAARVFGPFGLAGTDELSRFAFVWASFAAAAVALEQGGHHAFTLLRERLSGTAARLVAALAEGLTMLALLLLAWHGTAMALRAQQQLSPALGLPMSVLYAAMPCAAGVMALLVALRWAGRTAP